MLNTQSSGKRFDLTFHLEWKDGFGAQGWKLDVATSDPQVIACTAYTGEKTQTSVLVHDILDHLVSGFWLSGYVNEARATAIHGIRNGIEVRSSYEWMANEILNAKHAPEQLMDYLPPHITDVLPALTDTEESATFLLDKYGLAEIRNHVIERFFRIGLSGVPIAISKWQEQRLAFDRMHSIGLCLQALLVDVQEIISSWNAETATGNVYVGNDACEFTVATSSLSRKEHLVKQVV